MLAYKLGVDLGTSNTAIASSNCGILLDEPSVIAFHRKETGRSYLAAGTDAKLMLGKTPKSIDAVQPFQQGVISNFDDAEIMIRKFFKTAVPYSKYLNIHVCAAITGGATPVERRAIHQSIKAAGAKKVGLLDMSLAAALGASLPIFEPKGSMIVDIGGGATEIAVISLGGIVARKSIKFGGDDFDYILKQNLKKNFELNVGKEAAEKLKFKLGCGREQEDDFELDPVMISGVGSFDWLPKAVNVANINFFSEVSLLVENLALNIKEVLDITPPDLLADIYVDGITLTGGGSLLKGLAKELTEHLEIQITVSKNPKYCAAYGAVYAMGLGKKFSHAIEYEL